jgi:hypothetical protein
VIEVKAEKERVREMGPELNFLRPGDCLRSMTMLEKYMEKLGQSLGYSILTMETMDV